MCSMPKTIAFFIRHFTFRGTEVSTFCYAKYNEAILGNKSIIIHFTPQAQRRHRLPMIYSSYAMFKDRFRMFAIDSITDMAALIKKENIDAFYTQTDGCRDLYQFENSDIWGCCVTIKHCVFNMRCLDAKVNCAISSYIAGKARVSPQPITLPHIVDLPVSSSGPLDRETYNIPPNAVVFGYHGGAKSFTNPVAINAVKACTVTTSGRPIFFLFMNQNDVFGGQKHVVHLPGTTDYETKSRFIQTCDAMLHARVAGETFGLSCAEFAVHNKYVITSLTGDTAHVEQLNDRALLFTDLKSLQELLTTFDTKYAEGPPDTLLYYTSHCMPENVMEIFAALIEPNV